MLNRVMGAGGLWGGLAHAFAEYVSSPQQSQRDMSTTRQTMLSGQSALETKTQHAAYIVDKHFQ